MASAHGKTVLFFGITVILLCTAAHAASFLAPVPVAPAGTTPVIAAAAPAPYPWPGPAGTALRAREIESTPTILSGTRMAVGQSLSLQLFDDVLVSATVVESFINVNGTTSTTAHVHDSQYGRVVLAVTKGQLKARISIPEDGRIFAIEYNHDKRSHFALELDPVAEARMNSCWGAVDHGERRVPEQQSATTGHRGSMKTATVVIDILVVYSNDALSTAGSLSALNNQIATGMALANDAHSNSTTGMYFNLLHTAATNYTGSGDLGTDLGRVRSGSDGYMDEVPGLRDSVGADYVNLIVGSPGGGIASLLMTTAGDSSISYSVIGYSSYGSYTVGHEIGHNMGLHHAADQNYQPGPTSWYYDNQGFGDMAAGYHWHPTAGETGYCSMLTYTGGSYFGDSLGHIRVGLYSDPYATDHGMAAGNATTAYNANVLRSLKSIYAAYRDRPIASNTIVVDAPAGGEAWASEGNGTIRWDSNGVTGNVKIELLRAGAVHSTIAASTDNDRLFEWSIPAGLSGTNFRIRVTSINEPGISGQSAADFTIKETFYDEVLNTNPGFTTTGGWEYGAWTSGTGDYCGPNASYDGSDIYDTNLTGGIFGTADLTTTAIDCSDFENVSLRFAGWFSVYDGFYARVQISTNGTSWSDLYSVTAVCSGTWTDYDFDISGTADGQSTVYIRWKHDDVTGTSNWAGMSVDNISLIGISSASQDTIFTDDFESSNTTAWSTTNP